MRLLVATDVKFYSQTFAPLWWDRHGELDGYAEWPDEIGSLDADRAEPTRSLCCCVRSGAVGGGSS
jgi:hypothetical protein